MAKNSTEANVTVTLNGEAARNELKELTKQMDFYREAAAEAYKQGKKALGDEMTKNYENLQKNVKVANKEMKDFSETIQNLSTKSINELKNAARGLERQLKNMAPDDKDFAEKAKQYQTITGRVKSLENAYKSVTKQNTGFLESFNKLQGAWVVGMGVLGKVVTALKGIAKVTKEVINASQTTGDAWNNAMSAMKTTTEAFFMSLSTGDWSAFQNGLSEALKKARELAELKDTLGSFQIAGGYMNAKYRVDYTSNMTEATDTENDADTRRAALDAAKADLEAQSEFTKREAATTMEALKKMFESWKGLTFDSEEEFNSFFDRLFKYTTTGADDAVNEIVRLKKEYEDLKHLHNVEARGGFVNDEIINKELEAQKAYLSALNSATKETVALASAAELNDEKQKELIQTYSVFRADMQRIEQDTRSYNKTRDRVLKQIEAEKTEIGAVMSDIDEWAAKEKQAALERYLANKNQFDSTADAYREYQDELSVIDSEADAKRNAAQEAENARIKAEAEKRKAEREKLIQQQQAETDKAYQKAMDRVAKQESSQILIWKQQYAEGIIEKERFEEEKSKIEEDFLRQRAEIAKRYKKDSDPFTSQLLDIQIKRNDDSKNKDAADKKKKYDEELSLLKQSQKDEETELKKQLTRNEITQDEYDSKMLESKVNYLKQSVDLAAEYGQDETQIMQAYLDAQVEAEILALQQMEKLKKEAKDVKDSLRTPEEVRGDDMAKELARLEELHDAGLLLEEDYEKKVQAVHDKYKQEQLDEDLGRLKGYFEKANKVMEGVSEFTSALQSAETAKLESEYQARLTAAGDNAEEREAIEAEYEQKKLDLQKKYADADMAINIAKAIAAGALASVEAIAAAGGNPVLSAVFIALIAATTAAEVASIIQQRNAIKNASAGGGGGSAPKTGSREMTGYAEGGYTEDHTTVTTVGERGREWVAPAWMVRKNPVTFSNLERYRKTGSHGRSGSVSRGFADGGFTENVSEKMQGGMLSVGDLEAAVETAIVKSMQNGAIRAYLVRNDLTELDSQTERFKKMTSR